MQTELIVAERPGAIERAAGLLRQGHLIAYPTDTLYGVGADPFDGTAINRLYQAKDRSLEKGIPILLADTADLAKVVSKIPAVAQLLIEQFWPGPLTLILPKHVNLPAAISPNPNIAVRIPDNALARQFIRASGGAVATSSANRTGELPALDATQALAALHGLVTAVLDGGPVRHGVASTIVDCTGAALSVLREGPISLADLPPETICAS